jgi:hypothetical protein
MMRATKTVVLLWSIALTGFDFADEPSDTKSPAGNKLDLKYVPDDTVLLERDPAASVVVWSLGVYVFFFVTGNRRKRKNRPRSFRR